MALHSIADEIFQAITYYMPTYTEERLSRAAIHCAILDFCLLGQVISRLDGREHPLHGEEGGQVSRVRRDDDEREEPPDTAHDPPRHGSVQTGRESKHVGSA